MGVGCAYPPMGLAVEETYRRPRCSMLPRLLLPRQNLDILLSGSRGETNANGLVGCLPRNMFWRISASKYTVIKEKRMYL